VLEVIEPGLLTTIQDGGRPDAVDLGVPVGGACDPWSSAVANGLVGNADSEAVLEMTLVGAQFRVRRDCLLGLAGADMGGDLQVGRSRIARSGETLAFGPAADGSGIRTYLAIGGGIDVPAVLGSRSTCLVGGFGGMDGRPLRAGDLVAPRRGQSDSAGRRWLGNATPLSGSSAQLVRVVRGPDSETATVAFDGLVDGPWIVSGRGDRQGIRLDGRSLRSPAAGGMLSRGTTWGTIQLPSDGTPIVLLADRQTVGGYPAVAVVIGADLPVVGQLGPGDELRFAEVSLAEAQRLMRAQAAEFNRLAGQLA